MTGRTAIEAELEAWADELRNQGLADVKVVDRGVSAVLGRHGRIDLGSAPRGAVLGLGCINVNAEFVHAGDSHLDITVGGTCFELRSRGPVGNVRITGSPRDRPLNIGGLGARHLTLAATNCAFGNAGELLATNLRELAVEEEVFIRAGDFPIPTLMLGGSLTLDGPGLVVGEMRVEGTGVLTIRDNASAAIRRLTATEPGSLLTLREGEFVIAPEGDPNDLICADVHIKLAGKKLALGGHQRNLRVSGTWGKGNLVEVASRARVEAVEFTETNDTEGPVRVAVRVRANASLLDAAGRVSNLSADERSTVAGAQPGGLRVRSIGTASGATLIGIAVDELDEHSLGTLNDASQFAPSMPRIGRRLVRLVRSMAFGGADIRVVRQRRARFWQQVVRLTVEKHSSGDIQSKARYAYAVARTDSAKGRERIWLKLYGMIGYGESVGRPIAVYLLLSLVPTLLFRLGWLELPEPWKAWHIVLAPLLFFRTVASSSPTGAQNLGAAVWLVSSWQLVGVVLIFFSLAAIRRVSKAE